MTSKIELPCKQCICFAICLHQEIIHCELLYNSIVLTSNVPGSFMGYFKGSGDAIYEVFKKYVRGTYLDSYGVELSVERGNFKEKYHPKLKDLYRWKKIVLA